MIHIVNAKKPHLWWNESWKLIDGCTRCSAGCRDCWALACEDRFGRAVEGGGIRVRRDRLDAPMHWRKPRVVAVWNDLFHEDVPFGFQERAFDVMARTPRHTYLVLTKRAGFESLPPVPPNLWLGVTCEAEHRLHRIRGLLKAPAATRFVNAHLLGPLSLCRHCATRSYRPAGGYHYFEGGRDKEPCGYRGIDWLPIECNRPFRGDPAEWWGWCKALVDQATAANVPVWVKQGPTVTGRVTHKLEDFSKWARRREMPRREPHDDDR